MAQGFTLERIISFAVDGKVLRSERSPLTGNTLTRVLKVRIPAGAVGLRVPLVSPLPADATPAYSHFILATDTPGVKYRLCSSNLAAENVRADGYLLRGDEPAYVFAGTPYVQHADGTTEVKASAPFYVPKTWHFESGGTIQSSAHISVMGGTTVDVWTIPAANTKVATSPPTASNASMYYEGVVNPQIHSMNYIFGPAATDCANLGAEGDGRVFGFWYNSGANAATRTALTARFVSDPYTSTQTDAEALANSNIDNPAHADAGLFTGTQNDTNYFQQSFHSQVSDSNNVWSYVSLVKDGTSPQSSGFTKTGNPLWSRITKLQITSTHSVSNAGVVGRLAGMYFGTPPTGRLQSVQSFTRRLVDRDAVCAIEFDAPTGKSANVLLAVGIS